MEKDKIIDILVSKNKNNEEFAFLFEYYLDYIHDYGANAFIFLIWEKGRETEDKFSYRLRVMENGNDLKVVDLFGDCNNYYLGKGISIAIILKSKEIFNKRIISSSNKVQSYRDEANYKPAIEKVWKKMVSKGLAGYDSENDFYFTLKNILMPDKLTCSNGILPLLDSLITSKIKQMELDELLGFEFSIDGIDNTSMSNGENAFIIYLKVDNKTTKSRKINLSKATYITGQRQQFEQDIWLSGFMIGETTIKPNSFKKAGLIFYKSKLKSILDKDVIYISIELNLEEAGLSLIFQKNENVWVLINKEKKSSSLPKNKEIAVVDIKLTPKQLEKMLLKQIERFEAFEEKLDVSIQNLSIRIDSERNWFTIFCELYSASGTTIKEYITIECVLYDEDGLIIAKADSLIMPDKFFGFQVIEAKFREYGIAERVSKIRIYPKKF